MSCLHPSPARSHHPPPFPCPNLQGPSGYHDRMASAAAQHAATGQATMYSFSGAKLPRSAYSMEAAQPPSNANEPVRRRRNLQATGSNGVGRHLTQAGLGPPATSNGEIGVHFVVCRPGTKQRKCRGKPLCHDHAGCSSTCNTCRKHSGNCASCNGQGRLITHWCKCGATRRGF